MRLYTWSTKGAPIYVVNEGCAYIRGQKRVRHRRGQKKGAPVDVVKKECAYIRGQRRAPIYVVKEGRLYTWSKIGCAYIRGQRRVRLYTWSTKGAPIYVVNEGCAYIRGQRRVRLYKWSKKGAP